MYVLALQTCVLSLRVVPSDIEIGQYRRGYRFGSDNLKDAVHYSFADSDVVPPSQVYLTWLRAWRWTNAVRDAI